MSDDTLSAIWMSDQPIDKEAVMTAVTPCSTKTAPLATKSGGSASRACSRWRCCVPRSCGVPPTA